MARVQGLQGISFVRLAAAIVAVNVAACSKAPTDTVLRCSASDIRHVFRIPASLEQVEDLSTAPAKVGQVSIAGGTYVLRFQESRDHYELVVVIDRTTGRGTRTLFDDEQQLIRGHGGFDDIVCEADVQPLMGVQGRPTRPPNEAVGRRG